MSEACRLIINNILEGKINSRDDLEKIKRKICREYNLKKFMSNIDILDYAAIDEKERVANVLRKKPTRTISGVAIVAVMCHPHDCPHGRCFYCPESDVAPPSYTGEEPAALRARMFNFHPYIQSYNRLKQLHTVGHPVDKVELIIMGGTFPSRDLSYQEWFVSQCLKAINDFGGWDKNQVNVKTYLPNDYVLLEDVQKANEIAKVRCIGITFETRPDYCKIEDVNRMLKMGVTRVELGVQTIFNNIYEKMERGHSVRDVIEANQILRDSGIKVAMHFMPGLLATPNEDYEMFKEVFTNPNFKPDMVKIYPCLVTYGSKLYNLWKDGKYEPYSDDEAIDLIVKIKKILPKWVRTMRIQRDIPAKLIEAGVKKSNLGELVYNRLEEENINCKCIRCREIGHRINKSGNKLKIKIDDFVIFQEEYEATGGKEIFLSYEDKDEKTLAGFLRLRLPSSDAHRKEVDKNTAIVRELHVYGNMLKIGIKGKAAGQHAGFGEKLLIKAEKVAIENKKSKLLIISGIGTRNYYRKFGYEKEGPYMSKKLI
ncbi:MAG: tRNA uridine(34) 5-carboxymethylaminomethyl modification radical SAM/GNAT enzyme Elp3 [Methanobacteriaceae archaeon]|nr:tRNA uridine(34) 5-carboxymethylaminomethyl modification radical SAM/GNAT enzyme Elp3 [Candidatus Methanorudis spinitermitis]